MDWIDLAHHTDKWKATVNIVTNSWVLQKAYAPWRE
jgi:hypothetical protein